MACIFGSEKKIIVSQKCDQRLPAIVPAVVDAEEPAEVQAKEKSMTAKRCNRQCTGVAPRSSATILRRTLRNLKKKTQERLRQETQTAQAGMPAGKTA